MVAPVALVRHHADMLDRAGLRAELIRLLNATGKTDVGFAKEAGIHRETIGRIRKRDDDYLPDYTTIASWLRVCGSTVTAGAFLHKFETSGTSAVTPVRDTSTFIAEVAEHGSASERPRRVSAPSAEDRQLLESLAFAILRAIRHPAALLTLEEPPDEESGSGQKGA